MAGAEAPIERLVHVILNPRAGRGGAGRAWEVFRPRLEQAGIPYVLCAANSAAEVISSAAGADSETCSAVLVVGGDGTVNDVVNGLLRSPGPPPPIGVLRAGTGNDWVRGFSPRQRSADTLLRAVLESRFREVDVGRVNGRYFVNNFGWGLEARVTQTAGRVPAALGRARYGLGLVQALANPPDVAARFGIDGISHQLEVSTVSVANGRSTGGGFVLCPDARPDDGVLDLFLAPPLTLFDLPSGLWHLLRGTPSRWSKAILLRGRAMELTLDRPLPAHVDGNLLPADVAHASIQIVPRALRVLH